MGRPPAPTPDRWSGELRRKPVSTKQISEGRGVSGPVRTRVLERDGGVCQRGYEGCLGLASEVDHIVNVASLGLTREQDNDEDNLQSVCAACHAVKSEAEKRAGIQ